METPKEFDSRFVIKDELVSRPSCVVYSATDKNLGDREVCVKVFVDRPGSDQDLIKDFNEQLKSLRSASHQALVPIIAGGEQDGWFYLAMELIKGPTLRDVVKQEGGPLEMDEVLRYASELAEGLNEIHQQEAVHGHVDTRAVMFKGEDIRLAGYYPMIIGAMQTNVTSGGRMIVEPAYISPEQVTDARSVDQRSDIYSLAAVLFEMFTGSKPFSASNPLQLAMMRIKEPAPSLSKIKSDIPPLVDAAIRKAMAKNPKDRFQSIVEFADALTGGKSPHVNPLAESTSPAAAERLSGTETVGVSMSVEKVQEILSAHESKDTQPTEETRTNGEDDDSVTGRMDVAATMMGTSASSVLRGSFVVLEGPRRGEKFLLEKDQVMIGSDPTCDISIAGKDIPPRYAIVIKRDSSYFAGALSAAGLTVNKDELEGTEEVELNRGDILHVGEHHLRFIAPGEVFTLHDDVADRTIDRPKSKTPMILGLVAVLLAVICGGVIYQWSSAIEQKKIAKKRTAAAKKLKREELIRGLIREGDEYFKTGALTAPVGANALEKFREVLDLDPEHAYAKRRLSDIDQRARSQEQDNKRRAELRQRVDQLLKEAALYFQSGSYISPPGRNAKDTYQQVLRLDEKNQIAREKLQEIDNLLSDLIAKVGDMLSQAAVYESLGQYISPSGENAYELIQEVLKIDPNNARANDLLLDMAAKAIYQGDSYKKTMKPDSMRKAYLTAQALGVDPGFITPRLRGAELMKKSRSAVVIMDQGQKKKSSGNSAGRYLDTREIERRIAALALAGSIDGANSERRFIDLGDN